MVTADSQQETKLVRAYTDAEKRLAVAALQRYGLRASERVLRAAWPFSPVQHTLLEWARDIIPTEEDAEFWRVAEEGRKRVMQAELAVRVPTMLEAIDKFIANGEASKMQSGAIAVGIFYDKLFPGPKMSGGGVSIQNAENVQLMVVSPTETGAPRRSVDASFAPVESPGAEDE